MRLIDRVPVCTIRDYFINDTHAVPLLENIYRERYLILLFDITLYCAITNRIQV